METYHGHVKTPNDAIILFEACRIGLLPRVQRRLSEKERQQIKSGSVFVWDEREAGMRRWTDGKSWSASRVSGSFLTYREMEGKRGGTSISSPAPPPKAPTPKPASNGGDSDDEPGLDGYRYKADGLMKQSFSITTASGQHLHLISYYARHCSSAAVLNQPSTDPNLRHIRPPKNMYPESTVNEATSTPALTRSPMSNPSPYLASPHPAPMPPGAAFSPYGPQYHPAHSYPSPSHTPPQYAIINLYPHHPGQPMHGQPIHYAPGHPYMYAHAPPPPTLLDRAPQHLGNPNIPPPPGRAPSYPSYTGLQHLPGNTSSRGPPPHMHSPAIPHHYAPAASEPGPQIPPLGAHVTNGRTSPPRPATEPATESNTLAAPATAEAGVSPGRQIAPSLGNILNNPGASESTTSRPGSKSPPSTGAQPTSAPLNGSNNNLPKLAEVGRPAMQAGIQALKALDRRALST